MFETLQAAPADAILGLITEHKNDPRPEKIDLGVGVFRTAEGMQTALEWVLTGRVFPAQEALDRGLVRSLHAPDELLPAARALAREIADHTSPVAVALARQMLWRLSATGHPMDTHRIDSRGIQSRGASADVREGVAAFLGKRAPVWPDRVSTDLPGFFPWEPEPPFR